MKKIITTALLFCLAAFYLLPGTAWAAPVDYNLPDDIAWQFYTLDGNTINQDTFADKVQLLVFYRTAGCANSLATIHGLASSDWARDERIQIIAVDVSGQSRDAVAQFKDINAANCGNMLFAYNEEYNYSSNIWTEYDLKCNINSSLAYNFVLADGKIRYAWSGAYKTANYQTAFSALLAGEVVEPSEPDMTGIYRLGISGSENYSEVYGVLQQLNEHRTAAGLSPLTMDEDLLAAAMQRAAECAVYYSHTRPDGGKCTTIIPGNLNKAENIAVGYPDGTAVMNAWKSSDGHNKNMLSDKMTAVGVGCFEYNGDKYWVQLFSSAAAKAPAELTGSRAVVREVLARAEYLRLQAEPAALTLQAGESGAVILLHTNLNYAHKSGQLAASYADLDGTGVAEVVLSGGQAQVKGLAAGESSLKLGLTAADGKSAPCTLEVKISVADSQEKPGEDKPGEDKPGDNKPDNDKPDNDKPDNDKPGDDTYTIKPDAKPSGSGSRRPHNTTLRTAPVPIQQTTKAETPAETVKKPGLSAADLDAAEDEAAAKYIDVKKSDWYVRSVAYVYKLGLMNGMREDEFAPHAKMTRGMLVTMLYRLAGEPDNKAAVQFADVPMGLWYSEAVNWAAQNGLVNGVADGLFAPDADISREQLAAVLYRYAQAKGYDVSVKGELGDFTDGGRTADWAREAMQWAVGSGLIEGLGENIIAPQGNASRAQVATMIMRFCENTLYK